VRIKKDSWCGTPDAVLLAGHSTVLVVYESVLPNYLLFKLLITIRAGTSVLRDSTATIGTMARRS
jgi:hypothetical protein